MELGVCRKGGILGLMSRPDCEGKIADKRRPNVLELPMQSLKDETPSRRAGYGRRVGRWSEPAERGRRLTMILKYACDGKIMEKGGPDMPELMMRRLNDKTPR